MVYKISLRELAKIAEEYGKVKILELVREAYIEADADIGLCKILYSTLESLPAISEYSGCHPLEFIREGGWVVPGHMAYKYVFSQWCKSEAWKLVYEPKIRGEHGEMLAWYGGGWWWPLNDRGARIEFIDKLIDIYKREDKQ